MPVLLIGHHHHRVPSRSSLSHWYLVCKLQFSRMGRTALDEWRAKKRERKHGLWEGEALLITPDNASS